MDYVLIGLLSGLAAIERKGFLQAMLSRPIALAPAAGLALGDAEGGLLLAPPLELFWLGAVNLGAALPAHETLGTVAVVGGAILAGRILGTGVTPAVAILAVLLAVPLAPLGRRADRVVERFNEHLAARAEAALASGEMAPAMRVNLYGLLVPFGIGFVLAPLGAAMAAVGVPEILRRVPTANTPLTYGWFAFAAFTCAAGAKALRAHRVPWIFASAAVLATGIGVLARGWMR